MSDERAANAIDRRLGGRIRARRLELGMSQERLAELLGVTFQQVQKYEKGVNRLAAGRLLDACEALEWSIERLFEGLSSKQLKKNSDEDALENALAVPGALEMVRLYAAMENKKLRARVLDLVRAMNTADE